MSFGQRRQTQLLDLGALATQLSALPKADLSVLREGVMRANAEMSTTSGSANDRMWSRMEAIGWMTSRTQVFPLPNAPPFTLKVFAVTEAGRAPIAGLLAGMSQGGAA